jgi:hypothetical protein
MRRTKVILNHGQPLPDIGILLLIFVLAGRRSRTETIRITCCICHSLGIASSILRLLSHNRGLIDPIAITFCIVTQFTPHHSGELYSVVARRHCRCLHGLTASIHKKLIAHIIKCLARLVRQRTRRSLRRKILGASIATRGNLWPSASSTSAISGRLRSGLLSNPLNGTRRIVTGEHLEPTT